MRVIPLTSLLSHKGKGCRSPNLEDTLSLDVKELLAHALREITKHGRCKFPSVKHIKAENRRIS